MKDWPHGDGAFTLKLQSVELPPAKPGQYTNNPATNIVGEPVEVSSTEEDFSYDANTYTWSFDTPGVKTLKWDTTVSLGDSSDVQFNGTITHKILTPASVEVPVAVDAECVDGEPGAPELYLPATEGIGYAVLGNVAAGETVTAYAQADSDHYLVESDRPDDGWVIESDETSAAPEITFNTVDCVPTSNDGGDSTPG